jgi:hypothetical protein
MSSAPRSLIAFAMLVAGVLVLGNRGAWADHKCDPAAEEGWSVVPAHEVAGETDSAPYQTTGGGDWFVDRTTTVIPFCHYFNAIGLYSMRSYSLAPQVAKERVTICQASPQGASVAVAPYAGPCPPK